MPKSGDCGAHTHEPHGVHAVLLALWIIGVEITLPRQAVDAVEKLLAAEQLAVDVEQLEFAVFVHRDAAVVEQVAVVDQVEAAGREQETGMLLQLLAIGERQPELVDDGLFFGGQYVRVVRGYGREESVEQRVIDAVKRDDAARVIDLVEQQAIFHLVMRTTLDELAFELELDHRHGFLHLRHQPDLLAGE